MNRTLIGLLILSGVTARADISVNYRNANALVHYDFAETSGNILDKSAVGPALDLEIYYPGSVSRTAGNLTIVDKNVIRSTTKATKIINACKASGSISVEAWIKNNETVERRSGTDAVRDGNPIPLKIVSFSNETTSISGSRINFALGQFYDAGNLYQIGATTSKNAGRVFTEPLQSSVGATIVPNPSIGRSTPELQKIVFTLGAGGVGRLYLTDRFGNFYLAEQSALPFGTDTAANYFSNWSTDAYLTLGNESLDRTTFDSTNNKDSFFQTCKTADCLANPNRYWKGSFQKLAIYCNEIPKEEVLGAGVLTNVKINPIIDVSTSGNISPIKYRAQEIYTRLTGIKTPITNPVLDDMVSLLAAGDKIAAATKATDDASFLNITVRDFAAKMSNRDETINAPLNDFTSTVIGFVRDDKNAKNLLTEDIVYYGDPAKAPVPSDIVDDRLRSNNHYDALDKGRYNLAEVLTSSTQKIFDGSVAVDIPEGGSGLLTTRQWMAQHAVAGTNRRLVEFAFRQFLCTPMDKIADSSGPDNVVARDIDRFPGGSHTKFTTSCKSCHTVMDGFRPAFARWTFSNGFAKHAHKVPTFTDNTDENASVGMKVDAANPSIAYKYNKNETVYPDGRITTSDSWVNNANRGANAETFAFTKLSGKGIKDFGLMIAESKHFQLCMAERVFKTVCKRDPASTDQNMLNNAATEFANSHNYNLRFLFQKIVTSDECIGGAL